jgi:nuclease-like protein
MTRVRELDRGVAGASVAGEYRRRRLAREADIDQAPTVIGHVLSRRRAPMQERAFRRGEQGELAVAGYLERRTRNASTVLLHDRAMPGGHGNIDHLAVTPTGVFVIDAKRYRGNVGVGRGFQAEKLFVNGRPRTKVVDGLDRQVKVVREALRDLGQEEVAVQGVLCFVKRNFAPGEGKQTVRGHVLLRRRPLARRLRAEGPLASDVVNAVALALSEILPRARVADDVGRSSTGGGRRYASS